MKNKKLNNKEGEFLSYDRQTKMSWATLLTKFEDVPVDYQPFFQSLKVTQNPFPYSVITPSYEGFIHRTQEKLVCLIEDCLYVANKGESASQALCLQFNSIQHIEFKTVLLDAHLYISGLNQNGQLVSVRLRFNSVSDYLFKKISNTIRQFNFTQKNAKKAFSFLSLEAASFKMANFTRHCLLPEENIIQLVWQPELRKSKIRIHIPFLINTFLYRTVFPHHVTLLTDQELILIRESERIVTNDTYGGIWDYVPLNKIKGIRIEQDQDGLLTLAVKLPNDQQLCTQYLPTLHTELLSFEKSLNKLLTKAK